MAKNVTWCLVRKCCQTVTNRSLRALSLQTQRRFEHAQKGYPQVQPAQNLDYQEVKTYHQFLDENVTGRAIAIKTLMKTLDLTKDTATRAVIECSTFTQLSKKTIVDNYDLLCEHEVFKSTIRRYIYALGDTTENVRAKIMAFKNLPLELNYALPLFQYSTRELLTFVELTEEDRKIIPNYSSRLDYLADRLGAHLSTICLFACSHSYIMQNSITKIVNITEFLIDEVQMEPKHILDDMMIYKYSLSTVRERVLKGKNAGIKPLRPWLVRCPIELINKAAKKVENYETLVEPDTTLEEHISKIMDCSVVSVKALIKRVPKVETMGILKLTNRMKLMKNYGYTIHDVYRTPKVLYANDDTLQAKYNIWMQHGLPRPMASIICSSKSVFEEKLKRALEDRSTNSVKS